jgi:hypothetical protein
MSALAGSRSDPASAAQKKAFQAGRTQCRDISIGDLKKYEELFLRFDSGPQSGFLTAQEIKFGLEKMGVPQTHLQFKALMAEIDVDGDEKVSYIEWLSIFLKAKNGTLLSDGLKKLAASIKVEEVGTKGAASFFEQKAKAASHDVAAIDAAYHAERKEAAKKKAENKAAFKAKAAAFAPGGSAAPK